MDLPLGELALRLLAATVLGGLVGLNRDLRHKPAGLRTHALVAMGAAALVAITHSLDPAAASRVMQGIITGIGFLGAGVILHRPDEQGVHGLTTAATIWVVAVTGIVCGMGHWPMAVVISALLLAILVLGGPIEHAMHRLLGGKHDEHRRTSDPPTAPSHPDPE